METKSAIVRIPLDLLAQALLLPPGVLIDEVLQTDGDRYRGSVALRLVGDGLEDDCIVEESAVPPTMVLRYYDDNGVTRAAIVPPAKGQYREPEPP